MSKQRIGIYPGTFDPVTNGHLNIIRRARHLVDHLIVAVALNDGKQPMFSIDQRLIIVKEEVATLGEAADRIEVRLVDGLLMDFVNEAGAGLIIRGLRAVSDFEYEFQMTGMNARLNSQVETAFLMASEQHQFVASKLVKEIVRLGGDVSSFVSAGVHRHLIREIAREQA